MPYKKTTKEEIEAIKNRRPASVTAPAKPRESIIKLAKLISNGSKTKITADDAEYYGLNLMVDDETADLLLTMKLHTHYTISQVAKKAKMPEAEVERIFAKACNAGVLEYWVDEAGHKTYAIPPYIVGSGEWSSIHRADLEREPERAYFFERTGFSPLDSIAHMVEPGGNALGMHVIPVQQEVERNQGAVDLERISYWLDKYDGRYAAMPCVCRLSAEYRDEGCGDNAEDWCIAVGDITNYIVETGKGHYITREEVERILQRSEELGYVHQVTNQDGPGKIFIICNCQVNSCLALRGSQLFNTPNMSRSAYVASVEKEKCVACGKCVDVCPAGAVKLGQKLCDKKGKEFSYPRHDLPDDRPWGEEQWDVHYRDNNRLNCHETGTAPCKTACPAHISIQVYLKNASEGKYRDALALIKRDNQFPAVCGRVCNKRCEEACTRGTIDKPVSIDAVKRFIAEQDLNAETRYVPPLRQPSLKGRFEEKIAIIGGGPAGLSCAFYLAEMGYLPTVFEKESRVGGMMLNGIPSFRLEKDLLQAEIDILKEMGITFRCGVEIGKDISIDELRKDGFKAFYLAIGAQKAARIGVPGDDLEGVMGGIDLLRKVNQGEKVSIGERCAVVGGGNVAMDVCRTAVRLGAKETYVLYRRSEAEIPAAKEELEDAKREGVQFRFLCAPAEILGKNGKVTAIKVEKMALGEPDAKGRRRPVGTGEFETIAVDSVLGAIGQKVDLGGILPEGMVINKKGTIQADTFTYQTAQPDIFVGGDAYTGPAFVIDAIAEGHVAAESIHRFAQNANMTIGRNPREFYALDKENIRVVGYDEHPRQEAGIDTSIPAQETFRDMTRTLTEEQVRFETSRCLGCGVSIVDPNKCLGCGMCTVQCGFDAIHLKRAHPECTNMIDLKDMKKHLLANAAHREVRIIKRKITGVSVDGNGR